MTQILTVVITAGGVPPAVFSTCYDIPLSFWKSRNITLMILTKQEAIKSTPRCRRYERHLNEKIQSANSTQTLPQPLEHPANEYYLDFSNKSIKFEDFDTISRC